TTAVGVVPSLAAMSTVVYSCQPWWGCISTPTCVVARFLGSHQGPRESGRARSCCAVGSCPCLLVKMLSTNYTLEVAAAQCFSSALAHKRSSHQLCLKEQFYVPAMGRVSGGHGACYVGEFGWRCLGATDGTGRFQYRAGDRAAGLGTGSQNR